MKDAGFDFFVSYNSRDVTLARRLTERLAADGYRVWFNEYCVHSEQQAEFQLLINRGLDRCREAVIVVGPGYAASPYCNVEVERILRRLPPDRIHVVVGDGLDRLLQLYPELEAASRSGPIETEIMRALAPDTASSPPGVELGRHEWIVREAGFAFDSSAWVVEPESRFREAAWAGALAMGGAPERTEHHTFAATFGMDARLLTDYARLDGAQADRIRERMVRPDDEAEANDRRRLLEELTYFREEASRVLSSATRPADDVPGAPEPVPGSRGRWRGEIEELGVHLYSMRIAGREVKQRLYSFRLGALPAIFRIYKLSFLHPLFGDTPFVVRFIFRFPDEPRSFYRAIPWCDALVGTFRVLGGQLPANAEELATLSADFTRRMRGGAA